MKPLTGFLELAGRRHSVRCYAARPVERGKIERCLEAARLAAGACAAVRGWRSWAGLAAWLLITYAAAAVGGAATARAGAFYVELARPEWAPPGWVFGPVWSLLYTFMAVAAWRVWRAGGFRAARGTLGLYLGQLSVNALWSWLFFAWRLGGIAFAEILLLAGMVAGMMRLFGRVSRAAAWLLAPYLAWLVFAAALAFAVWRRNPGLL